MGFLQGQMATAHKFEFGCSASQARICGAAAQEGSERWSRALLAMQEKVAEAGADFEAILAAVADSALKLVPQADGAIVILREGEDLVYRAASGSAAGLVGH